jgi:hypothetical protein
VQLILTGFEPYGKMRAGKTGPEDAAGTEADTPIYSVSTYEQSMTFYLRRTVTLVDYWDEFTFGLRQQPELSIPPSTVCRQWKHTDNVKAMAIISEKPTKLKQGLPCAWWRKTRAAWSLPICNEQNHKMNIATFSFIVFGVLLNAVAQLLLKAAPATSAKST